MTSFSTPTISSPKKATPLLYVLIFACFLFIGILVAVYFITKQSNPIMLDEHGKPVAALSCPESSQKGSQILA